MSLKPRYIVAYADGSDWAVMLAGINGSQEMAVGWYRLIYDDEGREAFHGGPYETAESAMKLDKEDIR